MKKLFSVLVVAIAFLAFNSAYAQTTADTDQKEKSSCAAKKGEAGTADATGKKCDPAACAAKKASASAENNTEEGSTKLVETAGVSEGDATKSGATCASKNAANGKKCDPAACTGKKASASVENNTEEGSTKMIESPGVSSEKKAGSCAKKAGCCKNKKAEN